MTETSHLTAQEMADRIVELEGDNEQLSAQLKETEAAVDRLYSDKCELKNQVLALRSAIEYSEAHLIKSNMSSIGQGSSAHGQLRRAMRKTVQAGRDAEASIWEKVAKHTENARNRLMRNHLNDKHTHAHLRALSMAVDSMKDEANRLRNGGSTDGE